MKRKRPRPSSGASSSAPHNEPPRWLFEGPGAAAHVGWEASDRWTLVVCLLKYSDALYAECVAPEALTAAPLGRSLVHAARFFGGAPCRWVFERTSPAIAVGPEGQRVWDAPLVLVAQHLGSEMRVFKPAYRGLCTSALDYLGREWFAKCRTRSSASDANRSLGAFLDRTAQRRPHPWQAGRSVGDVLAEERPCLRPLPADVDALEAEIQGADHGPLDG